MQQSIRLLYRQGYANVLEASIRPNREDNRFSLIERQLRFVFFCFIHSSYARLKKYFFI